MVSDLYESWLTFFVEGGALWRIRALFCVGGRPEACIYAQVANGGDFVFMCALGTSRMATLPLLFSLGGKENVSKYT